MPAEITVPARAREAREAVEALNRALADEAALLTAPRVDEAVRPLMQLS